MGWWGKGRGVRNMRTGWGGGGAVGVNSINILISAGLHSSDKSTISGMDQHVNTTVRFIHFNLYPEGKCLYSKF